MDYNTDNAVNATTEAGNTSDKDDMYEKLYKSLKTTRIFCIISSILTLALFIAFMVLFSKIKPVFAFMDSLGPAVDNIASIDVESVNEALDTFNREAVKIDWEKLATAIQELDVDALNDTINSLDVDALNKSLDNLNAAADAISALNKRFSSIGSLFGN